jgi:dolichol-phosphate mannosyltransferase
VPAIFQAVPDIYIVVVDDNSPDGTAEVVKTLQKTYPNLSLLSRKEKNGLGPAYIHAFRQIASTENEGTVFMMDADMSHDPKHLREMIDLRKEYDVIIGSRYVHGGKTVGWELYRRILSRGGNFYAKTITRMPIHDCTSGFNAISIALLKKINFSEINIAGYAFIMHLKYLLYKEGARFYEIPICFKNRVEGESKLTNMIVREGIIAPWQMIFSKK